ncbi:hypothetical protein CcCBS67573_g08402 [Chytriomyces confervae]|uniref:Uncharacterized protein n=1 Tax=Chytriomyces confervae TaxID=246404 RepID=A0A507EMF6_9FUNG|nr:hypothetical protein CcCBS67573_g08402 [Chytriomyces confervae]
MEKLQALREAHESREAKFKTLLDYCQRDRLGRDSDARMDELRRLLSLRHYRKFGVERKRHYDAMMVGLDSEAVKLEQEVKGYGQDIAVDQSRYHYLNMAIGLIDISQEKVLHEMKSYIGGDEAIEAQQKARGFKTYRDVYNKRIVEQENMGKWLREHQKEIKSKHEPNVKQLAYFTGIRKLLQLKVAHNHKVLSGGGLDTTGFSQITQDRLVL